MSNPIDELLKCMASQHGGTPRKPDWRDRMSEAIEQLDADDTALLIVCGNGRTRLIKSTNGTASEMLEKAIVARPKMNMK